MSPSPPPCSRHSLIDSTEAADDKHCWRRRRVLELPPMLALLEENQSPTPIWRLGERGLTLWCYECYHDKEGGGCGICLHHGYPEGMTEP